MPQFRIDATEVMHLSQKMQKIKNLLPNNINKILHQSINMTLTEQVRDKIEDPDPFQQIWKGELWSSIGTKTHKISPRAVTVDLRTRDIRYGAKVELGGDKSAQYEQIREWVEGKLGLSGKAADKAAINITKKLRREGAEAHPFMLPTLQAQEEALKRDYFDRVRKLFAGGGLSP